ncbi:MAG: EF-Tu/IF-2/RF-3 family GTPase [Ignavibacteriales bacterium]
MLKEDFKMVVEDIFTISGRGTIVTGKIESGKITVNDEVEIHSFNSIITKTTVCSIEMFGKLPNTAQTGDNVGLLLRDVKKSEIEKGATLVNVKTESLKEKQLSMSESTNDVIYTDDNNVKKLTIKFIDEQPKEWETVSKECESMNVQTISNYIDRLLNDNELLIKNKLIVFGGSSTVGCIGIVIASVFAILGFAIFSYIGGIIGIILGASISKSMSLDDSNKSVAVIKPKLSAIQNLFNNRYNEYIRKYNADKKTKTAIIIRTNLFDVKNNAIQYFINEDEIKFFPISIYNITIYTSIKEGELEKQKKCIIPYINELETMEPIIIKKSDIEDYTVHGSNVSETSSVGGGMDIGGALLGGLLFGTAGAILGGAEKQEIINKINDTREIQINLKNKKMIIIKGFDLYEELLCFIPKKELCKDKEINTKSSKESFKELKEMLDEGFITKDEYDKKKKELLDKI